jgi:hypothetical protein
MRKGVVIWLNTESGKIASYTSFPMMNSLQNGKAMRLLSMTMGDS